jgi:hypothetical protein
MPCVAGTNVYSNAVDIFNETSGTWSTAALSVARFSLAAISLPNVGIAIFVGGQGVCCHVLFSYLCVLCCAGLGNGMVEWAEDGLLIACALLRGQRLLKRCGHFQRDVWNMEHCSSQRSSRISCSHIAAECRSCDLRWWLEYVLPCFFFVSLRVVFRGLGNWMVEWAVVGLLIAYSSLMPCSAGSFWSNAVDIFIVTSGAWSIAALSVARCCLAATSLPKVGVAIFAGGSGMYCHVWFRIFACCVVRVGEWDG